jgi:hypothetical protein
MIPTSDVRRVSPTAPLPATEGLHDPPPPAQPETAPILLWGSASLQDGAPTDRPWLWHGYLAPGALTLLTSQWKSGKTTLISPRSSPATRSSARGPRRAPPTALPFIAGSTAPLTSASPAATAAAAAATPSATGSPAKKTAGAPTPPPSSPWARALSMKRLLPPLPSRESAQREASSPPLPSGERVGVRGDRVMSRSAPPILFLNF